MNRLYSKSTLVVLSVLSASFYNAWLLGYWLNPAIMHNQLLSSLQAEQQPYSDVFIGADIVGGAVVILLTIGLFLNEKSVRASKASHFSSSLKLRNMTISGLFGFGISTIIAALTSDNWKENSNMLHSPLEFLHGFFSTFALLILCLSMVASFILFEEWLTRSLVSLYFLSLLLSIYIFGRVLSSMGQKINTIIIGVWIISVTVSMIHEYAETHQEEI
ncbi:MAG: DUF998 domain-containing protein [Streptococcaceae bacterium]|nr:DUF998 domain-containing protein [Streptococcaceae bacterium]MCL2681206.1 DUF998 domain-containing protein [Streptococcaceae bacterium]MCL2858740.1 DUF998 domain-containing protein [Streptococcaceae bacterium]